MNETPSCIETSFFHSKSLNGVGCHTGCAPHGWYSHGRFVRLLGAFGSLGAGRGLVKGDKSPTWGRSTATTGDRTRQIFTLRTGRGDSRSNCGRSKKICAITTEGITSLTVTTHTTPDNSLPDTCMRSDVTALKRLKGPGKHDKKRQHEFWPIDCQFLGVGGRPGRVFTSEATEAPGFRQSPPTPATHGFSFDPAL